MEVESKGSTMGMGAVERTDNTVKRNKLRSLKITAVGDGMVGKTCMLITYTSKMFPQEYVPTVFDNYAQNILVDGQEYTMDLWDTSGQENYQKIRTLSYPHTNCVLLCYSINSRSSFENIAAEWHPEIRQYCPDVPVILIGTKKDLRVTNDSKFVSSKDAEKLRRKIRAFKSLECSALNYEGLDDIFVEAVRAATQPKKSTLLTLCFK